MSAMAVQGRLVKVEPSVAVAAVEPRPAGEEKTFRPYDPDQVLLMAPVLSEWVPEGDLAHFVSDLVESGALDLAAIYAGYEEERGYPPYDPRLMVKLLVYGYANGTPRASWSGRATVMWRCGCSAPISSLTTARSPASGPVTSRRWGSCSCRR